MSVSALFPYYVEARAAIAENKAEYRKACEEWAKQGFRPQYCIHGVNMWVDYDCACYRCEGDNRSDLEQAVDLAREWLRKEQKKGA
jgi:hypothetical protein